MKRTIVFMFFAAVNFTAFSQEKIFTAMNEKGERIFSVKAKWVGSFSEGMCDIQKTVLEGNKSFYRYGFIDKTGAMVIPLIYEKVHTFRYGVAWVKEPDVDGYYMINKKGERLTKELYKKVGYFIEGFSAVYDEEGKMGFVNREGKLVIPMEYLGDSFSEGFACVMPYHQKEEKYGFIDTAGKVVIPFQFKQAGTTTFENGECRAVINGVTCLINRKGEVIFKPTLTKNCMGFYNGMSASYTNYNTRSGWGYYDRQNKWVIKPQYDNAGSFNNGQAVVEKGKKQGVIDTTGKIIIPLQYETIYCNPWDCGFYGLEKVANGDKTYVTKDNKPFTTVPLKYLYSANGHSLLPYCSPENKYGYLRPDGTVFLEAQFDWTYSFHDGISWIKGDASSLVMAAGSTKDSFIAEFKVGDRVKGNWKGKGTWYPGTIKEMTDFFYLVQYDDGDQEWVVFDSLKRQ